MSPLLIVGILCSAALADVSHVLQGSAFPPANPSDVNSLAAPRSAFQSGNAGDFWWMDSNSPLKKAYDFYSSKCSSKGNCIPPERINANDLQNSFGPIDISNNPFLNGGVQTGSAAFSSAKVSYNGDGDQVEAFHSGAKIDISKNPFFNNQFVTAGNGEKIRDENNFLGVQPKKTGFATSHPLSEKKPFATSLPGGNENGIECSGFNQICVAKGVCQNGYTTDNRTLIQVRFEVQYCNPDIEECCNIASDQTIQTKLAGKFSHPSNINELLTAGKSSVPGSTFKFTGGLGSSPGQIQVLAGEYPDDKTQLLHLSETGAQLNGISSTPKSPRDADASANSLFSVTPDYSNFDFGSDARFGSSTFKGPDYLPPLIGTTPAISTYQPSIPTVKPCPSGTYPDATGNCISVCPPGTIKNIDGSCQRPTTAAPQSPFGTILLPNGRCETPSPSTPRSCPPGTFIQPDGSCKQPFTPTPPTVVTCPFGSFKQPDGSCKEPISPSTPKPCPPGTFLTSTGICSPPKPKPTCPFGLVQTPDGSCEEPITTPRPCPPSTIRKPDGSCQPKCIPGTYLTPSGDCKPTEQPCPPRTLKQPDGSCTPVVSPTPRPCPPGTFLISSGSCEGPKTPVPCPFGTIQRPGGICEKPTVTPTIGVSSSTPGYEYTRPCPFGSIRQPDGSCETPTTPSPATLRPLCPIGTFLGPSGSCEKPVSSTTIGYEYPKPCPPGTIKKSNGICETITTPIPPTLRPSCPQGTFLGHSGICEKPTIDTTTIGYEYPKPCPPGTIKTISGLCETPTTPRPSCSFGTYLNSAGKCEPLPSPTTPRPSQITTSKEYLPPVTPTQPTTTPKPNPADGYHYSKPTPTFGYPSTLIPSQNNINNQYVPAPTTPGYLPPSPTFPENQGSGSNINSDIRYPDRTTSTTEGTDNNYEPANTNSIFVATTRRPPPVYPPSPGEQNLATPVGCAAALKCVQEIYCTAEGFISPVPVVLNKEQELLRAPTTVCKDIETGITGKCCRDPNYKDPWPSANLVNGVDDGQYKEDNFYGQRELLGNNRLRRNSTNSGFRPARRTEEALPPPPVQQNTCGERHFNTVPKGEVPLDANFAEIPWQAMILRDSNRSLLCGGAIIRRDVVITAAHCVEGLPTSDVLIKGGEWKLGIDEEPLPFQIVKVAAIVRHPEYQFGSYNNDLALLILDEKLRLANNIGTICLPPAGQIPKENCIATGWGKRILQLHAKGALMHHIDVNVVDSEQCQQRISDNFQESESNYKPNMICGESNIDQCKVDYGSALACANSQGQYFLSGIYAWDTGCRQRGQIGGYVAADVPWIDSMIGSPLKELKKLEKEYLLKTSN